MRALIRLKRIGNSDMTWTRLFAICLTGAALATAGFAKNASAEVPAEQCLDSALCPVSYVRLSTQKAKPYLHQGSVMKSNHGQYFSYRRAIRKFPDVLTCLQKEQRTKKYPDLRYIDWGAIGSNYEAEVCIFRIMSSIQNAELSRKLFSAIGFDTPLLKTGNAASFGMGGRSEGVYYTSFGWNTGKNGVLYYGNPLDYIAY